MNWIFFMSILIGGNRMKNKQLWSGVFPDVFLPFQEDQSLDEAGFRQLIRWIISHDGIQGIVVNGHTIDSMTLSLEERVHVVRIAAEEVQHRIPVISGLYVEETYEAIEQAQAIEKAGGDGILVMPPHSWLRYSMQADSPVQFFEAIASAVKIGMIVDQYPKWTEPSYTTEQLLEIAEIDHIVSVCVGTREMAQYEVDVRALKKYAPDVSILTCHDEYLLPTLIQGVDGALVGIASFVPDLIVELVRAVQELDLTRAQRVGDKVYDMKQLVYKEGDPSLLVLARIKEAMYQRGILNHPITRSSTVTLTDEEKEEIRKGLIKFGYLNKTSAIEL
jgi:4-hydroxy-tetrahydrodipicolinate synthase